MSSGSRPLPLFLSGLLLLLLGAAWASIETEGYLPRLAMASGALLLVLFVIRHARDIRFLLLQVRSHSEPGPTTSLLLLALVLALGALAATRLLPFVDLTAARLNSLAPESRAALRATKEALHLDAFFMENSPSWELAGRYLTLYSETAKHVVSSLQDPDRQPARARELGVVRGDVIVIRHGAARTTVHELTEEAITQGILRVLEGRPRRVGLLSGHGEPARDAGGDTGITGLIELLRRTNIESREISLLSDGAVPEDIDALLIIHPRSPLYPSEQTAIRAYLEQSGGGLGLWLEPGDSTGLEPYLRMHAVGFPDGVIRDPGQITNRLELGSWAPALAVNPAHEIGAELRNSFVAAPQVRPLEVISPHPMELNILPLLKTPPTAEVLPRVAQDPGPPLASGVQTAGIVLEWETTVGEAWVRGPDEQGLPPRRPTARVIVMGDASMISNRYIGIGANRALAQNSIDWLTRKAHFLNFGQHARVSSALKLDRRHLRWLVYLVEFGLPLLLVTSGLVVWMRRRARS
jgi:hypothetical protein